jgi:hypothetical protein
MPFRPYLRSLLSADRFQRDGLKAVAAMRQERQAQSVLYPPRRLEVRATTVNPPQRGDRAA